MKVALITANIDDIDFIKPIPEQTVPFDYYCYDKIDLPEEYHNLSCRLLSKYPKLMSHLLLPGYDVYIWIDGRVEITSNKFIEEMLNGLEDMKIAVHPDRANVYEELAFVKMGIEAGWQYLTERYKYTDIQKELKFIGADVSKGLPLYACGIFARRNNEKMNYAMEYIWTMCLKFGSFEQPFFSYIEHIFFLKYSTIGYHNKYFAVAKDHGVHPNFNFITASHKSQVLLKNLAQSVIFREYPLKIQRNFSNVMKAYNQVGIHDGIKIYVHHDVLLPHNFKKDLTIAIKEIEKTDKNWGVLGVAGSVCPNGQQYFYGNLSDRGKQWGNPGQLPTEVQTLDELILIVKDKRLRFDEKIPSNHLYGVDLCLQANLLGMKNYVINAYLQHNSTFVFMPEDFTSAREYIIKKYKGKVRNIATTCTLIDEGELQ